jgi:hypothetical protein
MTAPVSLAHRMVYQQIEDPKEDTIGIAPLSFTLAMQASPVLANSRLLNASMSMELVQDSHAFASPSFKNEVATAVAQEIGYEIVTEVVNEVITSAKLNPITQIPASTKANRSLSVLIHLNLSANDIARSTRRGVGNYVITSSTGLSILAGIDGAPGVEFRPTLPEKRNSTSSLIHEGDIWNGSHLTFRVYSFQHFDTTNIPFIVGYNNYTSSSRSADTGVVYCPYTLINGYAKSDEKTFAPMLKIVTRYGLVNDSTKSAESDNADVHNYYRMLEYSIVDEKDDSSVSLDINPTEE